MWSLNLVPEYPGPSRLPEARRDATSPHVHSKAAQCQKIAPDLDDVQLAEICDVCVELADGMVCTNTTIEKPAGMNEAGGLSGTLMNRSTDVLRKVRARRQRLSADRRRRSLHARRHARENDAGADLVQVYTSFIYEGPICRSRPRSLRPEARGEPG